MSRAVWVLPVAAAVFAGCSSRISEPSAQAAGKSGGAEKADAAVVEEIVIPEGVSLRVRTDEPLNTRRNRAGDSFRATLLDAVKAGDREILPAGVVVNGHVTNSSEAVPTKGRAVIGLTLDSLVWQGREYRVRTTRVVLQGPAPRNRLVAFIKGGAGIGAILRALGGAAKDAASGEAERATGPEPAGKEEVGLPPETAVTFALRSPVRL